MKPSRRVALGLLVVLPVLATLQWRARWLRDHPLNDDAVARLGQLAERVEGCLRQQRLGLSEANAPRLRSCVCPGPSDKVRAYCHVGNGFVAYGGTALPPGLFRVADDTGLPTQGMAYVPAGAVGPSDQEFDRNFGSFGPSSGPRRSGWYRVSFCLTCD